MNEHAAKTMMPSPGPTDADEGYALVQKLVFSQVHKFLRQYGGEWEELLGEAHVAFIKGHNRFMEKKTSAGKTLTCPYSTEVQRWVWYELFDAMRTRVRRAVAAPMVPLGDGVEYEQASHQHHVELLVSELSKDAELAAKLILDTPDAIYNEACAKGGKPRNFRSTVRAHLAGQGWNPARINAAFNEIRDTLG